LTAGGGSLIRKVPSWHWALALTNHSGLIRNLLDEALALRLRYVEVQSAGAVQGAQQQGQAKELIAHFRLFAVTFPSGCLIKLSSPTRHEKKCQIEVKVFGIRDGSVTGLGHEHSRT